ncbi:trichoplein keratin filament-binding protein [Sitodiplosis mosellana]|uniref:trichoplein keratin filament-binding protein n=1 Tax=Sitodiplosis mosellana TaxID=263140 RepID=UPI0024448EC3|nr:trichoplein keratin filament-binding protein [Sitodiplosis mosellana]
MQIVCGTFYFIRLLSDFLRRFVKSSRAKENLFSHNFGTPISGIGTRMKGVKLYDANARKRDIEEWKLETKKTVDKYFDKWSKITSRYEQWTAPEYYKSANSNFQNSEEKRNKTIALDSRREKLKKLLDSEKEQYAKEIKELSKPKSRVSTETLRGIKEAFKRTEEERKRLEFESQLYKRWRPGSREENILLSSRSNNEALAKMNWLDKQIAQQVEREKTEQQREIERLRLLEELRKDDERLSARKVLRDEEVVQLKQFQEQHLAELKLREAETEKMRKDEFELRECEKQLKAELANLNLHVNQRHERIKVSHNLRRIKLQLKNLSESVLKDLYYDIGVLERLSSYYHTDDQQIARVRDKFEIECDLEVQKQRHIEAMYESEAKVYVMRQQEIWLKESQERERILREMVDDQLHQINNEIDYIITRQRELGDLRDSIRRSIDSANDRIKNLLGANSTDDEQRIKSAENIRQSITPVLSNPNTAREDTHSEICLPDLFSKTMSISDSIDSPVSSGRPRFGRKRVAWT